MEKEHLAKLAPTPLGDEETLLAHECVDSRVCGLSPRGASRPRLNRPAKDGEVQVMVMQVLVVGN